MIIWEFGHSYGKDGTHFFIKALQNGENKLKIYSYLNQYYKQFMIKSSNEIVDKDIGMNEDLRF